MGFRNSSLNTKNKTTENSPGLKSHSTKTEKAHKIENNSAILNEKIYNLFVGYCEKNPRMAENAKVKVFLKAKQEALSKVLGNFKALDDSKIYGIIGYDQAKMAYQEETHKSDDVRIQKIENQKEQTQNPKANAIKDLVLKELSELREELHKKQETRKKIEGKIIKLYQRVKKYKENLEKQLELKRAQEESHHKRPKGSSLKYLNGSFAKLHDASSPHSISQMHSPFNMKNVRPSLELLDSPGLSFSPNKVSIMEPENKRKGSTNEKSRVSFTSKNKSIEELNKKEENELSFMGRVNPGVSPLQKP